MRASLVEQRKEGWVRRRCEGEWAGGEVGQGRWGEDDRGDTDVSDLYSPCRCVLKQGIGFGLLGNCEERNHGYPDDDAPTGTCLLRLNAHVIVGPRAISANSYA